MNNTTVADKKYVDVTDGSFTQEVLESNVPVLVDFWASWCGPCRMISPLVESLAVDFAGKAKIAKVNVDENPGLCSQFSIRSIPTLLIFKNGKLVDTSIGASSKTSLTEKLSKYL
ncbi:thioredoxin [Pedosphaera parvula]|uniref:Thioredoxin n=1 Tax=Pedosphaera parvula (strain Ellin514) TaxID=320771 RepID=B9XN75_PEDPL|nr:thioredoxin [Pedosphaera parvula]EEF58737.1 thioredoxin [Pedosphaera parvula Ellin514]